MGLLGRSAFPLFGQGGVGAAGGGVGVVKEAGMEGGMEGGRDGAGGGRGEPRRLCWNEAGGSAPRRQFSTRTAPRPPLRMRMWPPAAAAGRLRASVSACARPRGVCGVGGGWGVGVCVEGVSLWDVFAG